MGFQKPGFFTIILRRSHRFDKKPGFFNRSNGGHGNAVSLLQNNRSLRGGTPSRWLRGHGSAVSLPRLIVGKRHCRILTLSNLL